MTRTLYRLVLSLALVMAVAYPACAAKLAWSALTPMQQEALAPVAQEWESMPEKQQKRLLATTKRYPQLSPKQKQRFLDRLTAWSKLTPDQRDRAREKYKALSKVAPDKREEIKRMVLEKEAEKPASNAAPSTNSPE